MSPLPLLTSILLAGVLAGGPVHFRLELKSRLREVTFPHSSNIAPLYFMCFGVHLTENGGRFQAGVDPADTHCTQLEVSLVGAEREALDLHLNSSLPQAKVVLEVGEMGFPAKLDLAFKDWGWEVAIPEKTVSSIPLDRVPQLVISLGPTKNLAAARVVWVGPLDPRTRPLTSLFNEDEWEY